MHFQNKLFTILTAPVRWPLQRLRMLVRDAAWRIMHDREVYRGITLWRHFKAPHTATTSLKAAIDLIGTLDPISFANAQRLLPGGIVADATDYATAWYSIRRKSCVIGAEALRLDDTEDLALCIIHEMCHARLIKWGFGYDTPDLRVRVERICIRREIAFARKMEQGHAAPGYYTEWLDRKLAQVAVENYTDAWFTSRYRREYLKKLRMLKQIGTPYWLRRLVVKKARRRWKKHARMLSTAPGKSVTAPSKPPTQAPRQPTRPGPAAPTKSVH